MVSPLTVATANPLLQAGLPTPDPLPAESAIPKAVETTASPVAMPEKTAEPTAPTSSALMERVIAIEQRESVSLMILACLAILFALYATRAIMLPITLALLMALTLRPVVRRMRRLYLPDPASAGLLLAIVLGITLISVTTLIRPAQNWIASFPESIAKIKSKFHDLNSQFHSFSEVSHQVQEFTKGDTSNDPLTVQVAQSTLSTNFHVLSNTSDIIASVLLVIGLSYFFLAFGDSLLNNTLRMLSSYSDKKRTVELVKDVERGVAHYLFLVTTVNFGLGIVTMIAMWLLGVPNPALWGVMAFAINYIPVFGSLVGFALILLASILTFDNMWFSIVPPSVYLGLCAFEANLITPPLLGRSMSLNPILVFLALIFWGWIWGIGGAFLAVPLLAVSKLACEKFERTKQIATLIEA